MSITWAKINNDTNGNPRYVCHYLNLLKESEKQLPVDTAYKIACKRANRLGGRKYHIKSYGGGIVFSTYNLAHLEQQIELLKGVYNEN